MRRRLEVVGHAGQRDAERHRGAERERGRELQRAPDGQRGGGDDREHRDADDGGGDDDSCARDDHGGRDDDVDGEAGRHGCREAHERRQRGSFEAEDHGSGELRRRHVLVGSEEEVV